MEYIIYSINSIIVRLNLARSGLVAKRPGTIVTYPTILYIIFIIFNMNFPEWEWMGFRVYRSFYYNTHLYL